jgi:catechol 2,3-dioxygenase-like lactoylglutathione lyase family enzyme
MSSNNFNLKKDHDTIRVKDLERSAAFYRDILGLEEIPNGGLGNHIRWFQFNDKIQLHLVREDVEIQHYKGFHMAISSDMLDAFMNHLKANEIPFENGKGQAGGVTLRPDGVRQIYFRDPDGYWIEANDNALG